VGLFTNKLATAILMVFLAFVMLFIGSVAVFRTRWLRDSILQFIESHKDAWWYELANYSRSHMKTDFYIVSTRIAGVGWILMGLLYLFVLLEPVRIVDFCV
jgi:hypothetical protein